MKIEVDSLRKVRRELIEVKRETRALPRLHRFWLFCVVVLIFIGLVSASFFGTIGALELKDRTDILKLFQNGRYLVMLQNNAEMRPTGGFLGSFAVVNFSDYRITDFDFNTNIYKIDNAYAATHAITPPAPLATINQGKWTLHDSNFAVDFPEAAQTIQWFYEQETGQALTGVIALNASSVQNLLRLTGPIEMPDYNTTISAENFFEELATKIEKEYFYNATNKIENEPKTILKDLVPRLIEKTKALPKLELVKLLLTELNHKQILLQSNNEAIEKSILSMNWGGKVAETASDYLYINNANITETDQDKNWGAKTSLKIEESIDYEIKPSGEGLVSNLTLTRSHTGSYLWPDGVNINWTRVLVPEGSVLQSAELNGQDITNTIEISAEAGKTTFGLWLNTAPQTSNVLEIEYRLPDRITSSNYQLTVQKQPGNLGDDSRVVLDNDVLFHGPLDSDKTIR